MTSSVTRLALLAVAGLFIIGAGCESAPVNPFFADSLVPIGHGNSAQTDNIDINGPEGPSETLTPADMTYTHLGPAHFGIAISPEYPNGKRAIWSNGGDRISKLDYDTLAVIDEYPLTADPLMTPAEADAEIALLDSLSGADLANAGFALAIEYLLGLAGVYYLLDSDNTLFVGGSDSIIAYRDVDPNPADQNSAIEMRDEWLKPAGIGGNFVGANLTFDGKICMVTNEGWIVLVERDFSSYQAIQLPGGENAAAHNDYVVNVLGFRPGAADWVRNSMAIDEDGGIYVPSFETMHKVVWNGTYLSIDEADGAWHVPYSNTGGKGSGATPSLMGFGPDEEHFVVITDGNDIMNVEVFWRDEIPAGWVAPAGALSNRTAGLAPADMGNPSITAIQSEQSVVVGGYSVFVVNNEPTSVPAGFPPAARTVLVGFAGNDPAFAPRGIQKFTWNPLTKTFSEAWVNTYVTSANSVPIFSTANNTLYTVGARNGDWTMEAVNGYSGLSKTHYVTGSARYNSLFSGMNLDYEGRILHTTAFGIVRYERTPPGGP
ncbi:MAG: hypothetical protein R3228_09430 [Halioglobus sp.]|nr:hypothetical protein [Halioglobus sp.]